VRKMTRQSEKLTVLAEKKPWQRAAHGFNQDA
jgi:hypothetical protein